MRNFTVAFMILILFLSITFAIFKPMPAQNKIKNEEFKEKSYVEKLVTEPDATPIERKNFNQINSYSDKISQDNSYLTTQTNSNNTEKEIILPQQEVKKREVNLDKVNPSKINNNYENISKELSEKYNNNPNAVVSDEDFNYFMQKIIEQSGQR